MWERPFEAIPTDGTGSGLTQAILVQFHRHCPDPGMNPTLVFHDPTVNFNDYMLVRLVEPLAGNEERESYGLYAPGDYRPLDAGRERMEALGHNAPWQGDHEALEELMLSWERYAVAAIPRLSKFPLRAQSIMAVQQWGHTQGQGVALFEALRQGGSDIQESSLIRVAEVSFYRHYKLVEILHPEKLHYRRGYCFVRETPEGVDVKPVDGMPSVFYEINEIDGEIQLDTVERVCDYIRTFCWGVLGSEGPFLVPHYRRELNFHSPLTKDQLDNLPVEMDFTSITEVELKDMALDPSTPPEGRQRVLVIFGNAAFLAAFAVQATGTIEMVNDTARLMDLPLVPESFGTGNIFIPAWRPNAIAVPAEGAVINEETASVSKEVEPAGSLELAPVPVQHYGVPSMLPGDERRSNEEFLKGLKKNGKVSEFALGQELSLCLDVAFVHDHRSFVIDRVFFLDQLHLGGTAAGVSLHFRNCSFAAGLDAHL
ncbi:MAG: hypothetical protein KDC00_12855, partial [Flavobacteriales bacterium]|nr:hypothetical protein [Flavobacteriales bacterium]